MNTDTGEIYRLRDGNVLREAYETEREYEHARERMLRAQGEGKLVEVSEQVARQQKIGQRVEDRRRKRKAARAARKRNR